MRLLALATLALAAGGCGGYLEQLETEAADCPEHPGLRLGPSAPQGTQVVLNAYYLQEEAARDLRRGRTESPVVEEVLAKASALGASALRTNAYNDGADKVGDSALQVAPLTYDEVSFRGLDLVLTRAAAHGVKLVLVLGNSWNDYGGARRYVEWAGLPSPVEADGRFFTERAVVEHYRRHVVHVLNRTNTLDGLRYGEHPAVLAWELLNEPRGVPGDKEGRALRAWVDELAAVVKAHAPGHLVGTGEEGLETSYRGYDEAFWRSAAPARLFATNTSFRLNTASPWVDYASVHFYPEAWGVEPEAMAQVGARWASEHAAMARDLGKPLLVGEFGLRNLGGLYLDERRALYRGWLHCMRRTGAGGAAPWMFAYDRRDEDWDRYAFQYLDGTLPGDLRNRYADLLVEAAWRAQRP